MHDALAAFATAAAATPTPSPTPTLPDPATVTPGAWGFVITALVAVATILLVWDMIRRIRRGRVRADIDEQLDAEQQAALAVEATETDDDNVDSGSDGPQRP
ncbi:hypothetical protein ACFUTX_04425 [Microbacterium sp. NPDC057407]|uniref:hypothetical protein n=1 Tax=Microbacterium sp. NPDC057407 TaxID=3346120 RepID=UPI00366B32BB